MVRLMAALGAPGVGVAIALESVFPPLPSEVFLPLAGFAAARGEMSVVAAIGWSTAGSLTGALVLYGLGTWLGLDRLRVIADRVPLVGADDVDKADAWFRRYGTWAVFFGRMVPMVRSLVSIPAGTTRLPLGRFALLTTAGSLIWNTVFVVAGYLLGANWGVVERHASLVSTVLLVIAGLALAWFVVRRMARSRQLD
ncbi:DedA family protein [Pseudonocardia sp. CA-107938]|uniref:DedA family protein n=1 Tax=Pseudonocardia sp. CA-107938 TaxID=3240021 RepID=UPI003D91413A